MKNRLKNIAVTLLVLLAAMLLPAARTQADGPDFFTIAVVPDTQYYASLYPAIFDQQAQWIVDNAQDLNIVFVTQLGDLQDDYGYPEEWENAVDSMSIIRDAGIPYSVVPGNHDLNFKVGDPTLFNTYFPYTDFDDYTWYGGHYPEAGNTSNFELFSAMGQDFIILNLVCFPSLLNDATPWANSILTQFSDRKAIVVTHGYINTSGGYSDGANTAGLEIWNNIVRLHSNVIAVLCGHNSGQYYAADTGDNGNTIYNLLTDYQDQANGGNGWLRLYEFYPQQNKIEAVTYSPYLDEYDTTPDGQFGLRLEMGGVNTSSVSLDTAAAYAGDHVTVTGSLFNPSESGITVTLDGQAVAGGITANTCGNWHAALTLPAGASGAHSLGAYGSVTPAGAIDAVSLTRIPGWDLNNDRTCDVADLVDIGLHWSAAGAPGWIHEDLNADGVIDVADMVAIGLNWGQSW